MIELNISFSFGSSASMAGKLSMDTNINDLLFIFNPLPVLYLLTTVLDVSNFPCRNLRFEEKIPFLYEYNVTKISKMQSKSSYTSSNIDSIKLDLDDATISSQAHDIDLNHSGLLFSPSNFSLNVTCSNLSILLLTNPQVFRRNILSLSLAEANVILASNPDDERISVSSSQVVVSCASLLGENRLKQVEKLPYQNFLDIEKVEAQYHGFYQKNDQPNSNEIKDPEKMETSSGVDFIDVDIFVKVENSNVYISSLLCPLILGCNEVRGCVTSISLKTLF